MEQKQYNNYIADCLCINVQSKLKNPNDFKRYSDLVEPKNKQIKKKPIATEDEIIDDILAKLGGR